MLEAANVLGEKETIERVKSFSVQMAQKVFERGLDSDGSVFYEGDINGIIDSDKHWWPQAEAVVGFINAWQVSGETHFTQAAVNTWLFIEKYIIDHEKGEWFWKVTKDGIPDNNEPKVSEWKSPYHNTRACLEIISRLSKKS